MRGELPIGTPITTPRKHAHIESCRSEFPRMCGVISHAHCGLLGMRREEIMTMMNRRCERARILALVTASALLGLATISPAAADGVRWRTVVGIVQAGNTVGNIAGGGQPWTTHGGHASVDLSANHVE